MARRPPRPISNKTSVFAAVDEIRPDASSDLTRNRAPRLPWSCASVPGALREPSFLGGEPSSDRVLVIENFLGAAGQLLAAVIDGHGPEGGAVAGRVAQLLPTALADIMTKDPLLRVRKRRKKRRLKKKPKKAASGSAAGSRPATSTSSSSVLVKPGSRQANEGALRAILKSRGGSSGGGLNPGDPAGQREGTPTG